MLLPVSHEAPMRNVWRDQMSDRPNLLDLLPETVAIARWRMKPDLAGLEADHDHA
jgi:hypothetical protein